MHPSGDAKLIRHAAHHSQGIATPAFDTGVATNYSVA
jgi:hypothetical protein